MVNLGIDVSSTLTSRTGVHVYIREIVRALQAAAGPDRVHTLAPGGYPWPGRYFLAKVYNNLRLLAWIQWQLGHRARRLGCRVLISPDFLSPRRPGLPRIVVVYDAGFVKRPGEFNVLWRMLWQKIYLPALRQAEAVVTITREAKREVCEAFGLDPERVTVVPPACDPGRFKPVPEGEIKATLDRYGLDLRGYFLHVGVLEKRKNLPLLLRAFARVAAARPKLRLVLVGPPGPKKDLDDSLAIAVEIGRLRLDPRVILPGYVPESDLVRLYQGARAFVFPTRHEGFGIPVLEAFSARTAVVCSDLPVLREVAQDGALYFDPASEGDLAAVLEKVLDHPELCADLVARGQARLAEYSWDKSARTFLDLAARVAGGMTPGRRGA